MVDIITDRNGLIDLSFMASLECDLACPHCMYNSSPKTIERLDYEIVKRWVDTVNWDLINSCGFYGGEPGILMCYYQKFIDLVPDDVPKFVITNGTWSKTKRDTYIFLGWSERNNLRVFVSGTKYHRVFQNLDTLKWVADNYSHVILKGNDDIISMGRGKNLVAFTCTRICLGWNKPWRVALHPLYGVIFQSCDGEYPILQSLDEPFDRILENIDNLLLSRKIGYK